MNIKISKEELLQKLRLKIDFVREVVTEDLERIGRVAFKPEREINQLRKDERPHALLMKALAGIRYKELRSFETSPFFAKCVISHESVDVRQRKEKEIYFGKYEFSEQNIYSWVAPIAVVRFAEPGKASFKLPNGTHKNITLHEKEQYMIVDGKIIFYSHESQDRQRELIYQEHFSIKKGAFLLPEIIEVMEKAQDDVIRASHVGPFSIMGPAGSGKTTLALHRVAYLVQSPETMDLYTGKSIIVFVQDSATKDYFSHLLPDLGINDVCITTFFEWASLILKLNEGEDDDSATSVDDPTVSDASGAENKIKYVQNTECELEKLVLKNSVKLEQIRFQKNVFSMLADFYGKFGSKQLIESFSHQKRSKTLDRLDITIALMLNKMHKGNLEIHTESNRVMRMGKVVRHRAVDILNYSLVIIDEFQNYLPEQLNLIKSCVRKETQSVIYVGDMSQRTQHGTIKNWKDFGEVVSGERQIKLHKVYRNTKQILNYIRGLGYKVEIPEGLKEGIDVVENKFDGDYAHVLDETIKYIKAVSEKSKTEEFPVSIGVLGFSSVYIQDIKNYFAKNKSDTQNDDADEYKNIKVLSIAEAQGVEFDIVCIVGIDNNMFTIPPQYSISKEFEEEKRQIYKDLLYIALTRPIREMHILGNCLLKDIV